MRIPKLNVRLLRRIVKRLEDEPRRYDQGIWLVSGKSGWDAPPCGTIGCIAGWAVALSTPKSPQWVASCWWNIEEKARRLLGLTRDEAGRLFASSNARGKRGVRTARRKIDALIEARRG